MAEGSIDGSKFSSSDCVSLSITSRGYKVCGRGGDYKESSSEVGCRVWGRREGFTRAISVIGIRGGPTEG